MGHWGEGKITSPSRGGEIRNRSVARIQYRRLLPPQVVRIGTEGTTPRRLGHQSSTGRAEEDASGKVVVEARCPLQAVVQGILESAIASFFAVCFVCGVMMTMTWVKVW